MKGLKYISAEDGSSGFATASDMEQIHSQIHYDHNLRFNSGSRKCLGRTTCRWGGDDAAAVRTRGNERDDSL